MFKREKKKRQGSQQPFQLILFLLICQKNFLVFSSLFGHSKETSEITVASLQFTGLSMNEIKRA